MSRISTLTTMLAAVALALGLLAAPAAAVPTPRAAAQIVPAAAALDASAPAGTAASFAGVTVIAPTSWPVREVDGAVGCIRYDQHAVFLGEPAESTCPARLVGRTSTVQLLRADGIYDAPARVTLSPSGDDLLAVVGDSVRAIITVDPADPAEALSIAASITIDGAAVALDEVAATTITRLAQAAAADAADEAGDADQPQGFRAATQAFTQAPAAPQPAATTQPVTALDASGIFRGLAFDTCAAPSVAAMSAWRESAYGAVGIYVGGVMATCKPDTSRNPNLTADWVTQVAGMGWKLIPIYVGLQAPGTRYSAQMSTKPVKATAQGVEAAQDAVNKMAALGLGPGNPIYLDVEAWNTKSSTANASVISFTHGWTEELHRLGYASGFYSSAGGGIGVINSRALSNPTGFTAPDAMWYARWYSQAVPNKDANGKVLTAKQKAKRRATLISDAHVKAQAKLASGFLSDVSMHDGLWTSSQRGWQYLGGHIVDHKGFSINIDSNVWDAPAAPAAMRTITINTAAVATANFGQPYKLRITTKKQKARYTFTATDELLPPGLVLGPKGRIKGTPTEIGTWSFTVLVTDPNSPTKYGMKKFTITVGFPDVPSGNTFAADIAWLANNGVTTGYADGRFKPAASVTRQAMAAYLYRYTHPTAPTAPACTRKAFTDVKRNDPFCGEIAWLASTGVTTGYADGSFKPGATISRQAMAAFLYRLQHPEEMAQLKADQAADAATTKQRADALAAARTALSGVTADLNAAKSAVKTARQALRAAQKSGAKPKVIRQAEKALGRAEAARDELRAQVAVAKADLAAALAATKLPLPNRDICQVAPAGLTDIAADALFCRQIDWLVTTGITTGYADGGYRPAAVISRQAMAAFLHRLDDYRNPATA